LGFFRKVYEIFLSDLPNTTIHLKGLNFLYYKYLKFQVVPQWKLCVFVAAILIADIIFLFTWFTLSPFYEKITDISEKPESYFVDVIEEKRLMRCECDHQDSFLIGMYCFKGVLLFFGMFLFWQVRNSTSQSLAKAKDVGMAICNTSVCGIVAVACTAVLQEANEYDSLYIIVGVCTIVSVSVSLLLVFSIKVSIIIFFKCIRGRDQNQCQLIICFFCSST